MQDYSEIRKRVIASAKTGVEQDMVNSSSVGTKTDIVSVVQATDPGLQAGSRVYIIYNDNRPRLVAE